MNDPSLMRTRWAAIGAAVAVSIGAGGVGLLHATSPTGASAFVPITPCRLFDTRPEFQIGPRSAPLGPNDTLVVTAIGAQGECTGEGALPTDASGVVLNVTAVDATNATFLTLYPATAQRPNASSLNPTPGQPPTPNAVTTDLDANGEFAVYNRFGQVHVLADVVGYYTDHHHDDRYDTKQQVDAAIAEQASIVSEHTALLAEHDASLAAREPIMLQGEAPEFERTTIYEADGLRLRVDCGLSAGTVYLLVGASAGATMWGRGTWFSKASPTIVEGWFADEVTQAFVGSGSLDFEVSGTVVYGIGGDESRVASIAVNVSKAYDCPYRVLLIPEATTPTPAP